MSVKFAHKSDIGQVRKLNEDFIWVDEAMGVFIVADGLGGHEAGEIASRLTATTAGELIVAGLKQAGAGLSADQIKTLMQEALEASNSKVAMTANQEGQVRRMGATIVAAVIREPYLYICHAGDARAYMARGGTLQRLTEDDSMVKQLVDAGLISEDEARNHIYGPVVTKAVGQDAPLEPTFSTVEIIPQDWVLMCSDGLTDMLSEAQILQEIKNAQDTPIRLVERLTEAANAAGGRDNISVITIKVLT